MLQRKKKAARNTWYKLYRPLIETGELAGQRDTQRIGARVQVIPEESFNEYGDKKTNGFTLSEIRQVIKTGKTAYNRLEEDMDGDSSVYSAKLAMGDGDDEFTKEELKEIVETMEKEGGVYTKPSPMDAQDYARLEREGRLPKEPVKA